SIQELIQYFSQQMFEKIAQEAFLLLVYPGESNLLAAAAASSSGGAPSSTTVPVHPAAGITHSLLPNDLASSLTLLDIHHLMLQSGSGLWTCIHLYTLAHHDRHFTNFGELMRTLRQMELERPRAMDALYTFLNEREVIKELF